MRRVHLAFGADTRDRTQHRDRSCNDGVLADRGVNRTDIAPFPFVFYDPRHPALRRLADFFVRQVDPGRLIELKGLYHLYEAFNAHFQAEMICIAVTRNGDRVIQRRRAVAAHTASELVADLYASAAKNVRMLWRNDALFKGSDIFRYFPGRARRVTTLNGTVV